jgi:hypothetical protein
MCFNAEDNPFDREYIIECMYMMEYDALGDYGSRLDGLIHEYID